MPWFRDRLVSDRKSGCYGEVGCHGTHGYQNCRHGMSHMENGGLDRETHQECHWTVYDGHHAWQRSKEFTVKHFCEMGVPKSTIYSVLK